MKKAIFAAAFLAAASVASAVTFDNSASTTPAIVSVKAAGGDYPTIQAASAAFSAVTGGINRPWVIEIGSDLTETGFSYFGNSFGADGSLTIKPDATLPAGQPVVTFNDATAPAGIYGHVVFGSANGSLPDLTNTFASTGKYVIDGAKTGTSRDMTWQVTGASAVNTLVRIWGETNGMVVKNMTFIMNDTGGSHASVGLAAGQVTGFTPDINVTPDDTLIQNCSFTANGTGANGFAISSSVAANGTLASGLSINGLTVTGCDITVRQRGVFMDGIGDATVTNNRITLANTATTTTAAAIFHFRSNNDLTFTQTYNGNTLDVSSAGTTAGTTGGIGVFIDSGSAGATGTYNITNNVVKGPFATAAAPVDALSRGISASNVTCNYVIEHNSVLVPASSSNGASAGRCAAVSFPLALTTGTAIVRNNILVNQDVDGTASGIYFAAATGVTSANNNIVGSRAVGRVGTTDYVAIGDWTTSSTVDTTSQSVNPTATTPAWDANLRFASTPPTIAVVASSTSLTDIDGDVRPATGAFPGADQMRVGTICRNEFCLGL